MTVIVWDGKTLVADRRVNGDPSETASRATKILTFEDKPWRDDESLLAVRFAGNAHNLSFMLDYIKRHSRDYNLQEFLQDFFERQIQMPTFGMLFITDKRALIYENKVSGGRHKKSNWKTLHHNGGGPRKYIVVGSGEQYALRMISVMDREIDAKELLFLATMGTDALGGGFDQWSLEERVVKRGRCLTKRQKESLVKRFDRKISSHSIND